MGSQYRHRRTSDPTSAFPGLEPGEIAVNTANRQLAVGDANGATIGQPIILLGIRLYDTRASYATGDLMVRSGIIYRALVDVAPAAFNGAQWEAISGALNPNYVLKAGDTMTGPLALAADPANPMEAVTKQYSDTKLSKAGGTMTGNLVLAGDPSAPAMAATKSYVDAAVAAKAAVFISDTPPAGVPDNSLWWESDTGLLFVRYNDGDSTQWVLAMPMPDVSQFVQKAGDTMTGDLTISKNLPVVTLDNTSTTPADVKFSRNGVMRWMMRMGPSPDSGGAGSAFRLYGYNDAGDVATLALELSRADNRLKLVGDPTDVLHAATKQYVDTRVRYDAAQGLTAAQQQQGRQNVYAAPFDAMAYNGIQVNGACDVGQQYVGGNTSAAQAIGYTIDCWVSSFTKPGATFVAGQYLSGGPAGIPCAIGLQCTAGAFSAMAAGELAVQLCYIEGFRCRRLDFGTANASPITVSFWTYAVVSGTATMSLRNAAANRSYLQNFAVTAGVWQYQTFTVPGDTAGSWATDNMMGLQVGVCWGAGTNFQGANGQWNAGNLLATAQTSQNFFGTVNNSAYVTGLTVHAGSEGPSAARSPFVHRSFDQELTLCMRYWEKSYQYGTQPGSITNVGTRGSLQNQAPSSYSPGWMVRKRVAPTVTIYSPATGATGNGADNVDRPMAASNIGESGFSVINSFGIATQPILYHFVADARL